jgi:UTP--glucose-1-phosphate uridylyltransferase
MKSEPVEAFHIQGRSHDCGNKQGYLQTFVTYGRRHPELGEAFSEFVTGLS